MANTNDYYLMPCPFCGNDLNDQDKWDTIYLVDRKRSVYQLVCQANSGGCDASILGDSVDHCIEKWNRRAKFQSSNELRNGPQGLDLQESYDRYGIRWMDENEYAHVMDFDMTLESLNRFVNFLKSYGARCITVTDSNDELVDGIDSQTET